MSNYHHVLSQRHVMLLKRSPPEEFMVKSVLSRIMEVPVETLEAPKEAWVPDSKDIFIRYNYSRERWNINEIVIDDAFVYAVVTQISEENDDDDWDTEPCTINDCRQRNDWPKWKVPLKQS